MPLPLLPLHLDMRAPAAVYGLATLEILALETRATRGCLVQPDGGDICPLAVESVGCGDSVAAKVFLHRWT